ncbi:MAG: hypothetical protein ACREIW_13215, partial [Chthoniobacterales bacterium]
KCPDHPPVSRHDPFLQVDATLPLSPHRRSYRSLFRSNSKGNKRVTFLPGPNELAESILELETQKQNQEK